MQFAAVLVNAQADDDDDDPTDNWEQGMELGNIRAKAGLLYFLDHWIIQHK